MVRHYPPHLGSELRDLSYHPNLRWRSSSLNYRNPPTATGDRRFKEWKMETYGRRLRAELPVKPLDKEQLSKLHNMGYKTD